MPFGKASNRRRHPRVSICRLVKICLARADEPAGMTHVVDISETGLRFNVTDISDTGFQVSAPGLDRGSPLTKTLSAVKSGDALYFRLKLDPQHQDISILGKIAWITRSKISTGAVRVRAGVEFLDISEQDKKLIQVYVAAFQE